MPREDCFLFREMWCEDPAAGRREKCIPEGKEEGSELQAENKQIPLACPSFPLPPPPAPPPPPRPAHTPHPPTFFLAALALHYLTGMKRDRASLGAVLGTEKGG